MNVLYGTRSTLISAFQQLPLLLAGFVGLLGIGLGNLGLFMLFLGQAVLLPAVIPLLQWITGRIFGEGNSAIFVRASDIGRLVPSAPSVDFYQNVAPSYWLTHIWFFFAYLFSNALAVYNLEKKAGANQALYNNRLGRAVLLMTIGALAVAVFTVLRYITGTETILGSAISAVVGGGLGYAAFKIAEACGARYADVFGMVQQMLPPGAAAEKGPMTCVYSARA